MKKKILTYSLLVGGAAFLMLLKVFDRASALSVFLVVFGVTFLLYGIRHVSKWWEYVIIAVLMGITFEVRFYGTTGDAVTDILLGFPIGLIMFFLMAFERLFKKFENHLWYTLLYPLCYLAFMYFTEVVKINLPFRLDTYFSCMSLICQITSISGIYFLDFLLAWTASVIVYVADHVRAKKWILPTFVYAVVLCLILGFGVYHENIMTARENAKTDTLRIACVTGPYCGNFVEAENATSTLEETISSFTKIVSDAANQHAEILLFSEESYSVADTEENTLLETAKRLAKEDNIHLVLAYELIDSDGSEGGKGENKLCWVSSDGEILYEYTKHCIIPFIETSYYVCGDKGIEPFTIAVHGKTVKVATAICYDSDFDLFMANMGKDVDLLLLPTWDWKAVAEEHFDIARLRAIANQTTVVRSVYDGYNAVIDSAGNVLACDNTNVTGYETVLVYDVPV